MNFPSKEVTLCLVAPVVTMFCPGRAALLADTALGKIKFLSFRSLGGVRMLKVHAAAEVQLAACTCSIPTSLSYLNLRKLTLIGLMGFPSRDL